ncbi:MAG TPA: hypothetical protein VE463_13630, partial [Blastococcus sp.]|nr:hypothetical protein [Blastococcus sp.]
MTPREEILGRIRTALGPAHAAPAEVRRDYRLTDDRSADELLDVLTDRLEDYKATVVRCAPSAVADAVAGALRTALGEHSPADVVVAPGVPRDWRPDGS